MEQYPFVDGGMSSETEALSQLQRDADLGRTIRRGSKAFLAVSAIAAVVAGAFYSGARMSGKASSGSAGGSLTAKDLLRGSEIIRKVEEGADVDGPSSAQMGSAWPCRPGEELFQNKCFLSCSDQTRGEFPHRSSDCHCCKSLPCSGNPKEYKIDCPKFNKNSIAKLPCGPLLTDCVMENEELYDGMCYLKCSILTHSYFPIRTGMNTCSNTRYGGNYTMGFGPCNGFGVGGSHCMLHIPLSPHMGYQASPPGAAGEAPFGWTFTHEPSEAEAGSA